MTRELALLDTDVWSHLYAVKGRPHPELALWRRLLEGKTVVIAGQTRAEILVWLHLGNLGEERRSVVLSRLTTTPTVFANEDVVQRYARLTADAKRRGDGLADKAHTADRWVAATALAIGAPLLALDRIYRHDPDLVLLGREVED